MRYWLTVMVSAVFVASGIKDAMAEEWEQALLKLIVVVELWTIEYLKSLDNLAEEFKKKHREQLERQKDNDES